VASAALSQADGGAQLLQLVHQDVEAAAVQCIQRFLKVMRSRLVKPPAQAPSGPVSALSASPFKKDKPTPQFNADSLTRQLVDMVIVLQQVESYVRYTRHLCRELEAEGRDNAVLAASSSLDGAVTELGGELALAEHGLLAYGMRKSIEMDDVSSIAAKFAGSGGGKVGEANTSSSVEDSFFVAQCAVERCVATGNASVSSAVINHVNNCLSTELFDALVAKSQAAASRLGGEGGMAALLTQTGAQQYIKVMQDGMKKAGAASAVETSPRRSGRDGRGGDGGASGRDGRTGGSKVEAMEALVTLNNVEAAAVYTQRLREKLVKDMVESFEEGPGMAPLLAVVNELQSTSSRFLAAREEALSAVASQLRPRIRSLVSDLVSDKSGAHFLLDDAGFEQASTSPTNWAVRMVEALEHGLLAPFVQPSSPLSSSNCRVLLTHVADYLAKRVELALLRLRFSQLGGMQLDKDLRSVVSWFTARAGREVRDMFVKLSQFVLLLQLDSPKDTSEFFGANVAGGAWQLTADQVRKVLALRIDFGAQEITRLALGT